MDSKLKKGIMAILIANLINVVFNLGTNFLLPKYLTIESYSNIKTFQLYISYIGLLHFGYVDGMYLKYGGKKLKKRIDEEQTKNLSTMRLFQIVVTFFFVIIAILAKNLLLIAFSLSILPQNLINYYKLLYQATGEFGLYGRIMNVSTISTFVMNLLLLLLIGTDNYLVYIVAYVSIYYLLWIAMEISFKSRHIKTKGKIFDIYELIHNIKSGFLLTLGNFASILITSMDRWFVKVLMSTYAFAQYSFAVSVETFLNMAITPISTTLYSFFCRKKDKDQHKNVFRYIVVFATILPAAGFPIKFILECFLNSYIDSARVIFWLFAAQIFYIVIKCIYVNLYKVQKKQHIYFIKLTIVVLMGFIFNVLFYNFYKSMEAFSIGTFFSAVLWFFMSSSDFKYLRISIKEYVYVFAEAGLLLFCGFSCTSVIGFMLYMLCTAIMLFIFMNSTLKKLIRWVTFNVKKIIDR